MKKSELKKLIREQIKTILLEGIKVPGNYEELAKIVNKIGRVQLEMKNRRKYFVDKSILKKKLIDKDVFYAQKSIPPSPWSPDFDPETMTSFGTMPPGLEKVHYKDIKKVSDITRLRKINMNINKK